MEGVDLVLCTYQMAYRERDAMTKMLVAFPYLLVLDESHHIKNISLGPWAKTVLDLAAVGRTSDDLDGHASPLLGSGFMEPIHIPMAESSRPWDRARFEQGLNRGG